MNKNILYRTINTNGTYTYGDIGISIEEWLGLLHNEKAKPYIDILLCFLREPEHKGTCSSLGLKYGKSSQHFNSKITRFSELVQGELGRFHVLGTDGKPTYWCIRYPDFYKKGIVLDAKYKRLGSYINVAKLEREDIHQIISYITCLQANIGGFVSPLEQKQSIIPTKKIRGLQATLSIFGIEISKNRNSFASFCKEMEEFENDFILSLGHYCKKAKCTNDIL